MSGRNQPAQPAQTQQPQQPTAQDQINNLVLELANAYKAASNRADFQIQVLTTEKSTLLQQFELLKKQDAVLKAEVAELKEKLVKAEATNGKLNLQLDGLRTPSVQEVGDNI